ncbi:EAL domain-containing protein [Thalassomonas sp. M1454]|uniref:EAL domain-containing protein n=1 Tax=Thalassomonas sp. M1454 TaxID=2594477 RepID=UPI00117FC9CF|nr:EAL domain-containing protein [Thalassomonas sp. M1454]TRX57439.1 EAL domain-containing protein [Thalassomonas sp. M1454]
MKLQESSLKNRIFFFFILLLLAVQGVSFYTTQYSNERLEEQQLNSQLSQAETLLKNELTKRSYYLTAFAETAAKDYGLKQVLLEDTRSLLIALNNHRKRIDADIAIAINKEEIILAELLVKDPNVEIKRVTPGENINAKFSNPEWLSGESQNVYYEEAGNIFQLVVAPITSGDLLIGHIAFGYSLNDKLASDLAKLTGFSVGFGAVEKSNWQWLALKDISAEHILEKHQLNEFSPLEAADGDAFIFSNYTLGKLGHQQIVATTYQLRSSLIAAIKQDSIQLLLMILITLVISLLGAYSIASGVTKPLRRLVKLSKNIAKGNYESDIYVGSTKELNQLADQFGDMQLAIQSREKEITQQAFLDNLTQLPNRNQFYRDMHGLDQPFILCQINIRRLAQINDTLGHDVGDEVLQELAKRLKILNKPLYHTSGNGFLVRFDNHLKKHTNDAISLISKVIEPNFLYQNIALHLQVNIGVTFNEDWPQANQLLKEVDSAMQLAKRNNQLYQLYDRQIDLNTLDRLQLVNRLKQAIEKGEFTLFYQPKLNLTNNSVEEVEALVRWQHPVNGLITPDAFIQIAEQTGQMKALSLWVINEAIEQFIYWQSQGLNLKIAVNISPENLLDDDFCERLIEKLCGADELYKSITFEITEDAFVDHNSRAVDNISMLRAEGIYLSIDDYGTGYSSLAQLRNLSVQELKIDRCFIQKLTLQKVDQLIVSSTIQLAHQLGLQVVAEGVEDKVTLQWLVQQGCEKAQGYYISRPLPANEFSHWLQHSKYSSTTIKNTKIDHNEEKGTVTADNLLS